MNEIIEEWRSLDFLGYPNYKVSNTGEVMSLYWGIMSKRLNKSGYYFVRLYSNGKKKEFRIHRLVALAFVSNPDKQRFNVVNHIDENKLNNNMSNLEWCDTAYNVTYGTAINRRVRTIKESGMGNYELLKKINRKKVYKYDFYGNIVDTFVGANICYKCEGVGSNIINSNIPIRNGFMYSYRDDVKVDQIWDIIYSFKNECDENIVCVYQYDFNCNLVKFHENINLIKGYNIDLIKACLSGRSKSCSGYIWSYNKLSRDDLYSIVKDIMKYREIYRYNCDDINDVKVYDNRDMIEDIYIIQNIYQCCNGNKLSYMGYIWSYKELSNDELNDLIHRIKIDNKKKVYQYNLLGEFIMEWECIEDCIRSGYVKSRLHECFNGTAQQHRGFIWSKKPLLEQELRCMIEDCIEHSSTRPVYQYTKDYELVMAWNTTADANRGGYSISPVSECCRGKRKSYKGYIWSYRKIK